jgi:cobalamin biosynthetic protein CobC
MKHGGDLTDAQAQYGADGLPWLDLSTGINPHPWPIPPLLREAGWTRLPSGADLVGLLAAARAAYGAPAKSEIVAAPGTQALIQWLPRLAGPGSVAILGPTYSEHAESWAAAGFEVLPVADLGAIGPARHVVVVNPNNPDGRILGPGELVAAAETCAERGGWLTVDESFADVDPGISVLGATGALPTIVLRSFGKFYGLAGLRLGFAVAPPEIAGLLSRALGPWAVAAPAIGIGGAALRDAAWASGMRQRLKQEAGALDEVLRRAGLQVVGGTSLYRLVRHPAALALKGALAEAHIWVRAFDWSDDLLRFGLPPDAAARERLAQALWDALPHAHGTTTGLP